MLKTLGIINAVGTELTLREKATLEQANPELVFYPDQQLALAGKDGSKESVALPSPNSCGPDFDVLDTFSGISFDNHDGVDRWESKWWEWEPDNSDGADNGHICIDNGFLVLTPNQGAAGSVVRCHCREVPSL
ncbi:hypothetical protein [Thalassomonas actiniarum]|uniref:Uncharacterized protein n=1 Tax=Thalassomonas actiniarum TaxID=485447 RepID=A0AAE9YPT9_9GAMM|nr:hypothetical protein [Thalassomonas actiniarum]WDD97331.1 hypothetical protein SG35_018605 [Thalassomonas actiniarum]